MLAKELLPYIALSVDDVQVDEDRTDEFAHIQLYVLDCLSAFLLKSNGFGLQSTTGRRRHASHTRSSRPVVKSSLLDVTARRHCY